MSKRGTPYHVLGMVEFETGKAWLFQCWYLDEALWLPKSQCKILIKSDTEITMEVADWLGKKNDLIE